MRRHTPHPHPSLQPLPHLPRLMVHSLLNRVSQSPFISYRMFPKTPSCSAACSPKPPFFPTACSPEPFHFLPLAPLNPFIQYRLFPYTPSFPTACSPEPFHFLPPAPLLRVVSAYQQRRQAPSALAEVDRKLGREWHVGSASVSYCRMRVRGTNPWVVWLFEWTDFRFILFW